MKIKKYIAIAAVKSSFSLIEIQIIISESRVIAATVQGFSLNGKIGQLKEG